MLDKSATLVGRLLAVIVVFVAIFLFLSGMEFIREWTGLTLEQWKEGILSGAVIALMQERMSSLRNGR